ncbi:hypothetical protein [Allocoleopsis sp.]|uniref:hypothetical protein n=1 Tax=Allocoleopsis sp. TaxID=3088169 RepID=UPI002FD3619D
MSAASRYWRMVKIDAAGKRTIEEVPSAKTFFLASFPEFMPQSEVPDALIQRQLLHWMREAPEQEADNTSKCCLSQLCLVCFISSQIERVCLQLEGHFGAEHGFTCGDLLRCVLDHDSSRFKRNATPTVSTSYQSLPQEILQNFSPEQSSLATWTTRLVKHHRELNTFLLEHGVYLVSDWAILNDTSSKQIQRIFSQFHQLTLFEIQQAKGLLESYHAVYRAQRLKQRQQGIKGQCLPPTREQLEQIAQRLFSQTGERFRSETVMAKLQEMASRLRDYRIYVRGGSLPTESMDAPTTKVDADRSLCRDFIDDRNTTDEQTEFLLSYRQQFVACLDGAIAKVTEEQARKLQQKDPQKAEKFLKALQLFHCQGKSMGEIAKAVNLQAQYHVTRLLQLKSFRADIQQQFLVLLRDRVIHEAKTYTDPERLEALALQIEEALDEQVNQLIQEAATEAATATGTKKQTTTSLFAERLCLYLDTRRSNHD